MKRVWKWVVRSIGIGALIALAASLSFDYFGPGVAEQQILRALSGLGLDDSRATVQAIGVNRVLIKDLAFGADRRLKIEQAEVTYDPVELTEGRVKNVRLIGLQCRVSYRDGKLDFGSLARIKGSGGGNSWQPPFSTIELKAATVTIELEDGELRFPIKGRLSRITASTLDFDLSATHAAHTCRLSGDVNLADGATPVLKLRAQATGRNLPLPALAFLRSRVDADVTVEGPVTTDGGELRLASAATIRLEPGHLPGRKITPIAMDVEAHDDAPFIQWSRSDDGFVLQISSRFTSAGPITYEDQQTIARIESLDAAGQLKLAPGAPVRFSGQAAFAGGAIEYGDDVAIGSIVGRIPIIWNVKEAPQSAVNISGIRIAGTSFPDANGRIAFTDGRTSVTMMCPLTESMALNIDGYAAGGKAEFAAAIPRTQLTDGDALAKLIPAIRKTQVLGGVEANATVRIDTSGATTNATLKLYDATIRSAEYDASATGVNGTIALDRLTPLTTQPSQKLTIDRFKLGRITLDNGVIVWRSEDRKKLFIERTSWQLGDSGRAEAHAIRVDFDHPVIDTELFVESLNLQDWLTVLTDRNVIAEGRLYGRIPFTFTPDARQKLRLGEGFLYARPGKGVLKFADAKMVGDLLEQADPSFSADSLQKTVRDRLVEALLDFEYSMVRFDLMRRDGDIVLQSEIQGRGRTGVRQEIGSFIVNIPNFERLTNQVLFTKLSIGDRLDRFYESIGR